MLVADLITDEVPPLKHTDSIDQALHWMEEFKVTHLAVIKGKELLGIVSESDLLDSNSDPNEELGKARLHFSRPVLHANQHAYDALKLMSALNLSLLPVINEKELFDGCITQKSILEKMAFLSAVAEPGGIIELEMNKNDYSLTQIASIVEGNDAKVLSLNVASSPDTTKIEVTLKVNKEELSGIIQTFHRYNYNVKASFHQAQYENDLKNRFDEFMRYLDI